MSRARGRPAAPSLAAGGLVFHAGGSSKEFRAYDAKTGEKLWSFDAQTGLVAGPITFELDGKQYVAASVGGNVPGGYYAPNYSRMLVFAIGGTATLPPVKEYVPRPLDPPKDNADGRCREGGWRGATRSTARPATARTVPRAVRTSRISLAPPLLHSQEGFDAVVRGGALEGEGHGVVRRLRCSRLTRSRYAPTSSIARSS